MFTDEATIESPPLKLPADLLGPDSLFQRSAGDLAELREEVKELLIARLQGDAP